MTDRRTEIEAGLDIDSLDRLQAERRAIVEELAPLEAFDRLVDADRKAIRATIGRVAEEKRAEAARAAREKYSPTSAAMIEELSAGSPEYRAYLDAALAKLTRKCVLANLKRELDEKVDNRRALIYHSGKEYRST